MAKKKFALVGASARAREMYGMPMVEDYSDVCELVGVFDINYGRACVVAEDCGGAPVFTDFDEMIAKAKPDCIIISTVDKFHAEYIIRGIKAGVQVYTEKPMCINAQQCREILETERQYGVHIGCTFNDRYTSYFLRLKQLVPELVGKVFTMNFEWMLARPKVSGNHGASYYRRWNAYMDLSGGLALTKATHHFDDANWIIGEHPKRVSAFGKLRVYGKNGPYRARCCRECSHTKECEFYTRISPDKQRMYVDNEKYDGYLIDRCAFDEKIDIYDSMAVSVEYDGGAVMNYTETSTCAYEGFKMFINGEKGRMEINFFSNGRGGLRINEGFDFIRYIDLRGNIVTYSLPLAKNGGSHDGSDQSLRDVLFRGCTPEDPSQKASALDAAYSVLIGSAVNLSIKEGRIVDIDELIGDPTLLERDPNFDYTTVY